MSATRSAIRFRAMRPLDVPRVGAMERRNYEFPWSEAIFRDCIKARYHCILMVEDEALIGYGILQVAADEAHILNLCIDDEHQQRGHARHLLEHIVGRSIGLGAGMIFLEVRPSNPRAIELYRRANFNEIGIRKDYYDAADGREDALVMARQLSLDSKAGSRRDPAQ